MCHETYFYSLIEKIECSQIFFIHRRSNDIKIAVQKKYLRGQLLYRSPGPVKNGVNGKFQINII